MDLGEPPVGQETMAPSFVPLFYPLAPCDPLQDTPTRLPSRSDPVSEPVRRDSEVPTSEEHQELTIKAPPEVGICFPILKKNLLDMCVC